MHVELAILCKKIYLRFADFGKRLLRYPPNRTSSLLNIKQNNIFEQRKLYKEMHIIS